MSKAVSKMKKREVSKQRVSKARANRLTESQRAENNFLTTHHCASLAIETSDDSVGVRVGFNAQLNRFSVTAAERQRHRDSV